MDHRLDPSPAAIGRSDCRQPRRRKLRSRSRGGRQLCLRQGRGFIDGRAHSRAHIARKDPIRHSTGDQRQAVKGDRRPGDAHRKSRIEPDRRVQTLRGRGYADNAPGLPAILRGVVAAGAKGNQRGQHHPTPFVMHGSCRRSPRSIAAGRAQETSLRQAGGRDACSGGDESIRRPSPPVAQFAGARATRQARSHDHRLFGKFYPTRNQTASPGKKLRRGGFRRLRGDPFRPGAARSGARGAGGVRARGRGTDAARTVEGNEIVRADSDRRTRPPVVHAPIGGHESGRRTAAAEMSGIARGWIRRRVGRRAADGLRINRSGRSHKPRFRAGADW